MGDEEYRYLRGRIAEIQRSYQEAIERALGPAIQIYQISIPKIRIDRDIWRSEFELDEAAQEIIRRAQEEASRLRFKCQQEQEPYLASLNMRENYELRIYRNGGEAS